MGNYKATTLKWGLGKTILYTTSFRVYDSAVIFRQDFPEGGHGTGGSLFVAEFPALAWHENNPSTGYITWNGGMSGDHIETGRWPTRKGFGAKDGGPVLLFPGVPAPPAACKLLDQTSGAGCVQNKTYGCAAGKMWVDLGCAGKFYCAGREVSCASVRRPFSCLICLPALLIRAGICLMTHQLCRKGSNGTYVNVRTATS